MSSIYKVERRVDTVCVEMDISVAEQLAEILDLVADDTRKANSFQGSDINDLRVRLREDAEVRFPSPLYYAQTNDGCVILTDRI